MYRTRSNRKATGFTLVEILIVVIILGILAAIVIPQFTNASQDARKNSLTSQLQTIRSQLELYKLQHKDEAPPALVTGGATAWDEMVTKTDVDHATTGTDFGPYLQAPPINPLNSSASVKVVTSGTEPSYGSDSNSTADGWVYYTPTGKIFATSAKFTKIYDEADANAATNAD